MKFLPKCAIGYKLALVLLMVLYQKNKQTKKFKFYLFSIIGHVKELVIGIQNASIVGRFQIVNGDPVFITLEIQEIILWHLWK